MITNKDISIDSENGKITLNGDKYDLVTQGEIDKAVKDVYSVMGQMGAKNLLVPEWVETKTTENGVTYTFNADGTIIMNTDASGATANTNCNLRQNTLTTNNVFLAGTYTLTACPAGGSSTTYRTWARAYRPGTNTALTDNLYEEGNGVSFTVSEPFSLGLNVTVMSGYVCNNLTWKPMLRLAADTDNTYEPYAMTNKQLTDQLATKQNTLTFDEAPTASSNNPAKSGGIKTYVDNAVSELYVNIGSVTADTDYEAMGKAWDALTIYDKPVLVRYMESGVQMALMLKYVGGQFGMAMGMKYGQTKIIMMGVNDGTKTYATTATT